MIVGIREAGPVAPLSGAAVMAFLLLSLGACAVLPLVSAEQTDMAVALQADVAPARTQGAHAPQEILPVPREKPAMLLRVAAGETVLSISRRFGVPARTIIALNDLTEPYLLLSGQQLKLPRGSLSDARRYDPPAEAPRRDRDDAPVATTQIAAPAHEVRVVAIEPAPALDRDDTNGRTAETAAPFLDARATVVRTASPARDHNESASPPAPNNVAVNHVQAAPEPPAPPAPRVARADSTESPPSSLAALARRADSSDVPLPPTRNTFLWPIEGSVISGFGAKPDGKHNDGINIAAPVGSKIRAAQNGVVAYAGNELRGYGNLVLIRHDGGWMTAYAHNDSLLVGKGDVVRRGQVISRSGKSGRVSRPQAHFEIRRDGEPQDPLSLLTRK